MLGIGLFFVGITLIINGWGSLLHIDYRSLALINLFTGSLSFIINLIYMLQGAYYEADTGFLFAFTYLLVGIIYLFDLDLRIYGIFALFVAINTLPFAWVSWQWEQDPLFALIWLTWGVLWFCGFLDTIVKVNFGRKIHYFAIACGIFTTWVPGLLMLVDLY